MPEKEYFKKALSDFTYEVASGGAIRHMADLGYSVKQIAEQLDFPTPYEKVQKTVWEYFLQTGVLLLEEPGGEKQQEKTVFIKEYDKYGKPSFRKVICSDKMGSICWREEQFYEKEKQKGRKKESRKRENENLAFYLMKKWQKNEEDIAYISFDFGIRKRHGIDSLIEIVQALDEYQREYILGLPWENKIIYHKLNRDIIEIVNRLYEEGEYNGSCYFIKSEEKIIIKRKDNSKR